MIAIIADDLTGALDAAAPFAGRGLHTEVALTIEAIPDALDAGPDVISVNIGSRDLDEAGAGRAMKDALAALPADHTLFKKIDSRLKGRIVAELDVIPFRSALVMPAIPEFGRVVKDGHVSGFGVDTPMSIAGRLGRHAEKSRIPDCGSSADLAQALQLAQAAGVDLLVGARGLADALARQVSGLEDARMAEIPGGTGLFVVGSRDPITLAQIEALRAAVPLRYLAAPNGRLSGIGADGNALTLVQAVPGEAAASEEDVSRNLATSIHPTFSETADTLLVSGGATAQAVLAAMGITRLRLVGECLPGLGLAYAGDICIIAKSGGFGPPETLNTIATQLLRNGS